MNLNSDLLIPCDKCDKSRQPEFLPQASANFIEARPSKIHGMGCFASNVIPKNEIIIEYIGEIIDYREAVRRNNIKNADYSEYIFQVENDVFIDGKITGNISRYINHSCNPNCHIVRDGQRAFIAASRKISPGEELTFRYNLEESEPCCCGGKGCCGHM